MSQETELTGFEKSASDLISEDTKILEDGTVKGELKYIEGWDKFSSVEEEQSGNYFPVSLDQKYKSQPITMTKTGAAPKKAEDTDWIIRIPNKETTVEFKQDENPIITLKFDQATFAKKPVPVRATRKKAVAPAKNDGESK